MTVSCPFPAGVAVEPVYERAIGLTVGRLRDVSTVRITVADCGECEVYVWHDITGIDAREGIRCTTNGDICQVVTRIDGNSTTRVRRASHSY